MSGLSFFDNAWCVYMAIRMTAAIGVLLWLIKRSR